MSESPYPHPVNISKKDIEKLRVPGHGKLNLEPSDLEDMRPTQEFRNIVANVLDSRTSFYTRASLPLSKHIDEALAANNITR